EELISQRLWASAVFVRDYSRLGDLTPDQLLKLAIILHEIYFSYDDCARILAMRGGKTGDEVYGRYVEKIIESKTLHQSFTNFRHEL
ncbi:MAG: hypothetical protein QGF71_08075, partial [Rhodospirillales bacterium]|nr:hypothetical protein [Rhodospirillales bacterium]